MNEVEEVAYTRGSKAVWRNLLALAIRELGDDAPDYARLALERADAVAALRSACTDHGDNEWPDNLHLADVIEKHLVRHLSN